jgi:hypothetical protein
MAVKRRALVMYGRGGSLGNFKFFADDLVATELSGYTPADVAIENVERRDAFFAVLNRHPGELEELHIFSHSIGGGLFLAYGDPISRPRGRLSQTRLAAVAPSMTQSCRTRLAQSLPTI